MGEIFLSRNAPDFLSEYLMIAQVGSWQVSIEHLLLDEILPGKESTLLDTCRVPLISEGD